ncbi:MAG: pyruvate kinase [Candidatus Coatesbacteria bacterium]|nr:pyruvate kinase [Candidatus Coatesbacteria bacterium]
MRKTKIVATIGPSSKDKQILKQLISAGVNVFRLNFSHSDHESHQEIISVIKEASLEVGIEVAIMADLQGPKIRLGEFSEENIILHTDDKFILTTENIKGNRERASVSYKNLPSDVKVNDILLINDGLVRLKVEKVENNEIHTVIKSGGLVASRKGLNLPGVKISTPSLTEKDKDDLDFILQQEVDFVAISFIRTAEDLREVKKIIHSSAQDISIVAKIEKPEALADISNIVDETDVIMIARGDLGVEIEPERVPWVQKEIINECNKMGKPVIVATQMLESMIGNPQPTRAETTDVANAILDGADAVMLSGETAMGKYPVAAVEMVVKIANQTEKHYKKRSSSFFAQPEGILHRISNSMTHAALMCAEDLDAAVIITITESGLTAEFMSKYRPEAPIIALTPSLKTLRKLLLSYNVFPFNIERILDTDRIVDSALHIAEKGGFLKKNEIAVLTAGVPLGYVGTTNMIKVINFEEKATGQSFTDEAEDDISKEHVLKVKLELCNGCGLCVEECAFDLLYIHNGKVRIKNSSLCAVDDFCINVCPTKALYRD